MTAPTFPSWRAWAGLVISPLAWAGHHQFGSSLNFYDCQAGRGWLVASVGAVALLLAAGAGLVSWSARRAPPPASFVAILGAMSGALLSLTIAIQIGAALILPACFR